MTAAAAKIQTSPATEPRRISVLGATGSIGHNTLDLVGREPGRYAVVALTARTNASLLARQAVAHRAELAVVAEPGAYDELKEALSGTGIEAAAGPEAMIEAGRRPADWIMAAIVGAAGLKPTYEAIRQGTHVALANKECLVCAGNLFMDAAASAQAALLPVDSEHSAAFQAIDSSAGDGIERLILTASGGPFRSWSQDEIRAARPEDALKHPNWSMGPKITVDSATLMNKGLELIEAFHLFPVAEERLEVVIHPQSIIHCLVEYADGSMLAQMSWPDMRTPIAYALAWPRRMWAPTKRLDLVGLGTLTFEAPDAKRFPALRLAREALRQGGGATAVLNAANEVAVEAFLAGRIGFMQIPVVVETALERAGAGVNLDEPKSLDDVIAIDESGRAIARSLLSQLS